MRPRPPRCLHSGSLHLPSTSPADAIRPIPPTLRARCCRVLLRHLVRPVAVPEVGCMNSPRTKRVGGTQIAEVNDPRPIRSTFVMLLHVVRDTPCTSPHAQALSPHPEDILIDSHNLDGRTGCQCAHAGPCNSASALVHSASSATSSPPKKHLRTDLFHLKRTATRQRRQISRKLSASCSLRVARLETCVVEAQVRFASYHLRD
ncbi:hypothetical protein B0H16DRAFT_243761 [Mycena metata]|uniref:Uncharacterized protein n=1 Tax=Mycena metata TaxID=1033252 RepID=A0AAD7HTT4_9AGAR|nr:hypothetical protein B0H16DRAFT_243761 [Mycena metata]